MDPQLIIIIETLIIGALVGILITIILTPPKLTRKDYDLESGVQLVLYIYLFVLTGLIVFELLEILNPNLVFPDFLQADAVGILRAFGGVFLSAVAVFLTMRQYRESKHEELVKIVTPLYFEIEKILNVLLHEMSSSFYLSSKEFFQEWGKIKGTRDQIRISKINEYIFLFYEECDYYFKLLLSVKEKVEPVINETFNELVCKPRGYLIQTDSQARVTIRYDTNLETKNIFLSKYAIFGIYPIDYDDMDILFSKEKSWLEFQPHIIKDRSFTTLDIEKIRYNGNESIFEKMFESIEKQLEDEDYIQELRNKRRGLMSMGTDIRDNLESFIA